MLVPPIMSRVSIGGHPVHPMFVHFPLAFLLGVVATDAAYLYSGDAFWARAGLWLAGMGALGGWLASLVGLIDLLTVPRIRRLIAASSHAVFAVMMLSVASLNWLLRFSGSPLDIFPWGLYLSLLTTVLIMLTSITGGYLVYEYGVGVHLEPVPCVDAPGASASENHTA